MKKLAIIIFTSTLCALAQVNYPFPESNAKWKYYQYFYPNTQNGVPTLSISEYGFSPLDVTLGGKNFHVITSTSSFLPNPSYFRSENNKLYMVTSISGNTITERIIFDYNLTIGGLYNYGVGNILNVSTVTSITDFSMLNHTRKMWNSNGGFWIEGIGSFNNGLIGNNLDIPTCNCSGIELLCFTQNNQLVYLNPKFADCSGSSLTGLNVAEPEVPFQLLPNPSSGRFVVQLGNEVQTIQKIEIKNSAGLAVQKNNLANATANLEINVSDLPIGFYFIEIDFNNNQKYRQKLLIEK